MDIITYIPDLNAFRVEVASLAGESNLITIGKNGDTILGVAKIPVFYNDNESLCLVRCDEFALSILSTVTRLGVCENGEYIFDSDNEKGIYNNVRGNDLPYEIGVFA